MQINKFMGVVSSMLALSSVTKTTFAQGVAGNALMGDSRLGRKALIEAEGIPVSELLAQISRASGVILKADAVVADDKVVVFSAARPCAIRFSIWPRCSTILGLSARPQTAG